VFEKTPRRAFLKSCARLGAAAGALPLAQALFPAAAQAAAGQSTKKHIAVVGAGAFGGWTALHLLRRGARVTLLDAWGPGNARASSGGETRVIRATYGPSRIYVQMVLRALEQWREADQRWGTRLFNRSGVLWMAGKKDDYEKASLPLMKQAGFAHEVLTPAEAAKRYPQINFGGVKWAIFEPDSGYLLARQSCERVLEAFLTEGGEYRQTSARPGPVEGDEMRPVTLSGGGTLSADSYVFACGPWLGKLFPGVLDARIRVTRQEVYYFGPPEGDARFREGALPVWIDNGEHIFYGIPANRWRGFKLADDTRGPLFDPTSGDRAPSAAGIAAARDYLKLRFPALAGAPLVEARVCQYENSSDEHFILDRHPQAGNVWLLGGGSGHGFKHGPALGEMAAQAVLGQKPADPFFALARFKN